MHIIFTANMRKWIITYPSFRVHQEKTSRVCMSFEFPHHDGDYHIVGMKPHLDNGHVLHHIALSGCPDTARKLVRYSSAVKS